MQKKELTSGLTSAGRYKFAHSYTRCGQIRTLSFTKLVFNWKKLKMISFHNTGLQHPQI
jgi:hypothetical protein